MFPSSELNSQAFFFLSIFFFVFGSLLGSFCNVVILRMAEGRSVIFPPSACPFCKHRLSPIDLIPIFGWFLLKGKCRYCSVPISVQYPLVEASAALTIAVAFMASSFSPTLIPNATWGIFWLVVTVIWFRGEVQTRSPFLWPLAFWLPLSALAGSVNWAAFIKAVGIALAVSLIAGLKQKEFNRTAYFGVASVGLISLSNQGWFFPAMVFANSLVYLAVPVSPRPSLSRSVFLGLNLFGMIFCGIRGNWGF